MPNNSEQRKKRVAPIVVTVLVLLYMVPLLAASILAAVAFIRQGECGAALLFLLFYGAIGGAVVAGILLALRQRLREINGGEEEDASQY